MRGPPSPAGLVVGQLARTYKGLPGKSLKDAALGKSVSWKREFIVSQNHMVQCEPVDGKHHKPHGRMVRSDRYKYCVYDIGKHRESLVDMEKDPGEMVNLARNAEYKKILEAHRKHLIEWGRIQGDDFPVPGK